jgi:hypothetical protein
MKMIMKKPALIHSFNWYNKSVIEPFANPWLQENIVLGQISLAQIKFNAPMPILHVGRSGFAHARRLLDEK